MNLPYTRIALEQGSSEWLRWRQTKIGASDAAAIMGENPWKSRTQLFKEKIGLASSFSGNAATRRGAQLEPIARQLYESQTGIRIEPAVLVHATRPWQAASVDGITATGSKVVEIKCGEKAYAILDRTGQPPDYYYAQLQHILAVTGLPSLDYFAYLPGYRAITREIARDDAYIKTLIQNQTEFWSELQDALRRSLPPAKAPPLAPNPSKSTLNYTDGSKYEGELTGGRPHGLGKLSFADGRHYTGSFFEGKLAGAGQMSYPDGSSLQGIWDPPGVLQSGLRRFVSGDEYSGSFSEGIQDGYGQYRWISGDSYSGGWTKGKKHGFGVYIWPDGDRFEGNWESGLRSGHGRMAYSNGDIYEGNWTSGLRTGYGKMEYKNGDLYEGEWAQDVRAGLGTLTSSNGSVFKGNFSDDEPISGEIVFPNGDHFLSHVNSGSADERSRLTLASGSVYEGSSIEPTGIVRHESSNSFYLELLKATSEFEHRKCTDWKKQVARWNGHLLQKRVFAATNSTEKQVAAARARFIVDADKAICTLETSIEENEGDILEAPILSIEDLLISSPEERVEVIESFLHQQLLRKSRSLLNESLAEIRSATSEFKKLFGTSPWAFLGDPS